MSDELEFVLAYHQATKHSFPRMAPGPKTMDWANEPRPFRRFRGAELVELARPEPSPGEGPAYDLALTGGNVPPRPLSFDTVSQLLFDSLAISAWRRAGGAAWALRVNPSSGNLHPTEGYLISGPVPGLFDSPTVAHYAPREHGLEVRGRFSEEAWRDMALPEGTVLVGLSSIPWREAWKYGERAFRYLHLNVGHALAALSFASAALGWQASLLDCLGTDEVAFLLGLTDGRDSGRGEVRADPEAEVADCLVAVHPWGERVDGISLSEEVRAEFGELRWQGRPDRLSPAPVAWPLVAAMAAAAAKPPGEGGAEDKGGFEEKIAVDGKGLPSFSYPPLSLRKVIRGRRSSIAMDPAFSMTREDLFRALSRTIPGPGRFPFGLPPWRQVVDLAIYLHRVLGLDRGLYLLLRDPQHESRLRAEMRASFDWARPEGAPPGFFRLAAGDFRDLARALTCGQKIASDCCFTTSMIAPLKTALEDRGPWFYSRLHWECGIVGQTLYLEAEAAGLRGCGIGCFFDDPVTSALGLDLPDWGPLYSFAAGKELPPSRTEILPADPGPSHQPGKR